MKAISWDFFDFWIFMGGITFYPYQISLGFSLRYWPCIFTPSIRIHIGPIKIWLGIKLYKKEM